MTTNNPLLKVVAAEYVRDYTLRLTFNTDVQHGRGAAGGLYAADAEGYLSQATRSRIL